MANKGKGNIVVYAVKSNKIIKVLTACNAAKRSFTMTLPHDNALTTLDTQLRTQSLTEQLN